MPSPYDELQLYYRDPETRTFKALSVPGAAGIEYKYKVAFRPIGGGKVEPSFIRIVYKDNVNYTRSKRFSNYFTKKSIDIKFKK